MMTRLSNQTRNQYHFTSDMSNRFFALTVALGLLCAQTALCTSEAAFVSPAVAARLRGPYTYGTFEYKYAAEQDNPVLRGSMTELWAQVWYPRELIETDSPSADKLPIIFFLHGNHGTCGTGVNPREDYSCQYTFDGTCPDGYVVTPNHMGYGYVASHLATNGYIVVSINANRGITCGWGGAGDWGLNLARGRLVLRHIQLMSNANHGLYKDGTPSNSLLRSFVDKIDFNQVGLVGHSRGGEGVRAALYFYNRNESPVPPMIIDPVKIRAVFEIGAVDRQTKLTLDALDVAWVQLLPLCDGDVADLQGMKPFDRMLMKGEKDPHFKGLFNVFGANHNFFNTEWQTSDSSGCFGTDALFGYVYPSTPQLDIGAIAITSFFLNNLGKRTRSFLPGLFNADVPLSSIVTNITRVDRAYTPSVFPSTYQSLENFTNIDGQSQSGVSFSFSDLSSYSHTGVFEAAPASRAARVTWDTRDTTSKSPYLQVNFVEPKAPRGLDLSKFNRLSLRLARQMVNLNPATRTDFTIRLVGPKNALSDPILLSSELSNFDGPYGGPYGSYTLHPLQRSVLISLRRFATDIKNVYGVRFEFNRSKFGAILIGRISAVKDNAPPSPKSLGNVNMRDTMSRALGMNELKEIVDIPEIKTRRIVGSENKMHATFDGTSVTVKFESPEKFPVQDSLITLCIGDEEVFGGQHLDPTTHSVSFQLTSNQYAKITGGVEAKVTFGGCVGPKTVEWVFTR